MGKKTTCSSTTQLQIRLIHYIFSEGSLSNNPIFHVQKMYALYNSSAISDSRRKQFRRGQIIQWSHLLGQQCFEVLVISHFINICGKASERLVASTVTPTNTQCQKLWSNYGQTLQWQTFLECQIPTSLEKFQFSIS